MAYNKSKHVESAQKLLNQGKVVQAIAEYQQILKHEPRDQVTLMTVGELYIRQGETFQAIDYFERLAQLFIGDGFLTKAIAVYKRIAKLAPEEIRPLERLADLYVQQGVMSEARPLIVQLAEIHLKNNRQPEAVALLKKLLFAEPDNLRIQIRLADLYQAMGQADDAVETYISAAQRALARGDQGESEKLVDKALKLAPQNLSAVTVKARIYSLQGEFDRAAQTLANLPDLEKGGEQTELLLDLYLRNDKWDEATALAQRVFDADPKNFGPTQRVAEAMLESQQAERALNLLGLAHIPMIDAGEHEVVSRLLHDLAARLPGRLEPLEWLVDVYGRTSDSFRLPDALANFGDALVAAKQYDRAKEVFEQLVDREPESDSAKRKLQDVLRKLGLLPPEEAPRPSENNLQTELHKAPAPKVRPDLAASVHEVTAKLSRPASDNSLDEATERFIAQSLTDVDLFASYGLTQKAMGLLEAVLRRAPNHAPTLEKLLDFALGAGDDRRTAELAAQLERLHTQRGDARGAERFRELRRRFQRAAGLTDEDLAPAPVEVPAEPAESFVPEVAAEAVPVLEETSEEFAIEPPATSVPLMEVSAAPIPAAQAKDIHEVDLSDEWASLLQESLPADSKASVADAPVEPEETVAEFEIISEPATPDDYLEPVPSSSELPEVPLPSVSLPPIPQPDVPAFAEFEVAAERESPSIPELVDLPGVSSAAHDALEHSQEVVLELPSFSEAEAHPGKPLDFSSAAPAEEVKSPESEFELEPELDIAITPEPLVPAYEQKPPETPLVVPQEDFEPQSAAQNTVAPPPANDFASDRFLADLANEIDELGIDQLSPTFSEAAGKAETVAMVGHAASPDSSASVDAGPLKDVFDEFRAELGEMSGEDEDLETHYNLGIAFREMGLLEEAISEFQKVAKAVEKGRAFRYAMQCCTLLGLAFMEKGQPAIAAIWYERAMQIPGVDAEGTLALRYDLGVAQESAGQAEAALKSFSQVYAVNIDYRDVGERIAALQKTTR